MDLTDEVSNLKTIIEAKHANGGSEISKDKINWLPTSVFKTFPTQTHHLISMEHSQRRSTDPRKVDTSS